MELTTWIQFLGEAVCILFHTHTFEKDMNLSVLPSSYG